jgi:hypothetical protein
MDSRTQVPMQTMRQQSDDEGGERDATDAIPSIRAPRD